MKRMLIVLSFFMLFTFSGCSTMFGKGCNFPPCKTAGETRCVNNKVEICDGQKQWRINTDCKKLNLTCQVKDTTAYCGK